MVNDGTGTEVAVGAIVIVTVTVNGLVEFPDGSEIVPKLARIPVGMTFSNHNTPTCPVVTCVHEVMYPFKFTLTVATYEL